MWTTCCRRAAPLCILFAVVMFPAGRAEAQGNAPSPRLNLKDPTPREVDLEKLLASGDHTPADATLHTEQTAILNQRRQELLQRTSAQVSSLAVILQHALEQPPAAQKPTRAAERQVAGLIERLAGNVHALLAAKVEGAKAPAPGGGTNEQNAAPVPLEQQAQALARQAQELQTTLARMQQDTVSVAAMRQSADLETTARKLGKQLDQP